MADRREQRATCPTCGSLNREIKLCGAGLRDECYQGHRDCPDPWHESSPGAAEEATAQNEVSKSTPTLRLMRSAEIDEGVSCLSNVQLADELLNHVWAGIDILSRESGLLSEAIDRLRTLRYEPASEGTGAGVAATVETPPEDEYNQKAVDVIQNLAMLVRRLCHRLNKHEPASKMIDQALGYLCGEGLQGSILRAGETLQPASEPAEEEERKEFKAWATVFIKKYMESNVYARMLITIGPKAPASVMVDLALEVWLAARSRRKTEAGQ